MNNVYVYNNGRYITEQYCYLFNYLGMLKQLFPGTSISCIALQQ